MVAREIWTADIVYNGLGLPQKHAAVVVQTASGRRQIIAVSALTLAQQNYPDAPVRELGFALTPPPVNAHTHLDLSALPTSTGSYPQFIARVMQYARAGGRTLEAARQGMAELAAADMRVIGDIVTSPEVMRALLESELTGVAYWEVIEGDPAKSEQVFNETVAWLRTFRQWERPGGMRVGLAPHAPHTVSAPLLQRLAALAKHHRIPLQIHVAESEAELALHRDGSGPLQELVNAGLPGWQPSGLTPIEYLAKLGVLDAAPTLVHMVHVTEDDVRLVQRAGCTVIHCPRSNHHLGCGRFPWALYAKHGVTVALGTGSKGTSPSLDIQDELAFARELHGDAASDIALIWSAVKGGYRALGMTPPKLLRGDDAAQLYIWRFNGFDRK
jgi:cytosine/adenosine deaminase-related metal-dependent hydrolase